MGSLMNDFTKEELEYLYQFLTIAIESYQEPGKTYELRDKLQSLIDNYCEHESGDPKLVFIKECTKCHQHLETRPWRFRHAWSFIDDQE